MKNLVAHDPWHVVQDGFDAENNRVFESLFSLGNGHFGGRGNHEETYSGDSLPGNYLAGIYYPDPTRVGWWKNGYPDYFAKVLNAPDWKTLSIRVNDVELDLATAEVAEYRRELNMREGTLERSFTATLSNGVEVHVESLRFVSLPNPELGAFRYRITCATDASVVITSAIQGDVVNEDSNHEFGFWDPVREAAQDNRTVVVSKTKKTEFVVAIGGSLTFAAEPEVEATTFTRSLYAASTYSLNVSAGQTIEMVKLGANVTSRTVDPSLVEDRCNQVLDAAETKGFLELLADHIGAWERNWETSDVQITGDPGAQQGIRFNIFGLNSTFTGDDPDLNIGPKGFTGEKYGGVTYWDTEAFCLPFYLATSAPEVSKNLLRYRHRQLGKAIENAEKLGFTDGAALYPMVTINGEECHNEWEITFEEIHRNGAIAFAIFNYIRYTGDSRYLVEGGLDVLVAISRFWAQRVSWSHKRACWVMLGVTGPNEYENNVNNNWYTSLMAQWTLRYTLASLAETDADSVPDVSPEELARWADVAERIYLPEDAERGIFLQQSEYLDKEMITVADLDSSDRPLNQKWSWDRILRSPFIKQADVLQGMWVFEDRFDLPTLQRNFDFYEPRTVHESSLSPSIHAVLAVRLGRLDKALEMMLRTARLDLDDYNNDTEDGCHTTSMAGSWIAVVLGFGGLKIVDGQLHLNPQLPPGWDGLAFQILHRSARLNVSATTEEITIENQSVTPATLFLAGGQLTIAGQEMVNVPL
ncbi:MAG: glycoside hydrolase family 65 protein [Acidimicrobiales bacterium]|nr:glycoside hydrolase family 65 protein [Acidimicrobiales bacterium]